MQRIIFFASIVLFFARVSYAQSFSIQQLHEELWLQSDNLGGVNNFLEKNNFRYISSNSFDDGKLISFKKEHPTEWVSFFYEDRLNACSELHYSTNQAHFYELLDFVSNYTLMKPIKTYINEDGLLCRVFAIVEENARIVYELQNGMIQSSDFYGFTIKLMDYIIYSEYYEKYIENGN